MGGHYLRVRLLESRDGQVFLVLGEHALFGEVLNAAGVDAGVIRSRLELVDVGAVSLDDRLLRDHAGLQVLDVRLRVGQVAARLDLLSLIKGGVQLRQHLSGQGVSRWAQQVQPR